MTPQDLLSDYVGREEDYPDPDAAVISILSSPMPPSPSTQSVPALPPHLMAQAIRLGLIRGTPSVPYFLLAHAT
jgi:hypothetical protein